MNAYDNPLMTLIFVSALIVLMYSIGMWAGRRLEREIEKDKLIAKKLAEEAKKNARRRR
tara:strand:- start:222 stop:398 length:177 start_codon:yes stop_codon:yes gene_type:complete